MLVTDSNMFLDIPPADEPLPDKEWHKHLENMLDLGELNTDILWYLDYKQQYCINEIKKAYARKEYRQRRIGEESD